MNEYFTHSLNIAAYLVANGFPVKKAKLNDIGNGVFFFDRSKQLDEKITEYNNDEKIRKFIAAYREVKNLVKSLD